MTNAYNPGSRFTQRSPYGPRIEADGKTGRIRRGKGQKSARAMTTALSFVCLVVAIAAMPRFGGGPAWAQQQTAPAQTTFKLPIVKQIALTEAQIKGVLAAKDDIRNITDNAPEDIDRLRPETIAKLDVVAKRYGLTSYSEYLIVNDNIGLVIGGTDPLTRKYIGKEAAVRLQMARVKNDRKMSAADKKEELQELSDGLQLPLALVENKGNIALVLKYYNKIVGDD